MYHDLPNVFLILIICVFSPFFFASLARGLSFKKKNLFREPAFGFIDFSLLFFSFQFHWLLLLCILCPSLCLLWFYVFSAFWRFLRWADLGFKKITGCRGKNGHRLKMMAGDSWGSGEKWVDSGGVLETEMTGVSDYLWVGAIWDNLKLLVWVAGWLGMPFIELGTLTGGHP